METQLLSVPKHNCPIFPLIIIPDEINLTRRVLEPMHRFHRLAADIMLPGHYYQVAIRMNLSLDTEQLRVLNWRARTKDIAAVVGPPGCGKTTVGSGLAIKMIAEDIANKSSACSLY